MRERILHAGGACLGIVIWFALDWYWEERKRHG